MGLKALYLIGGFPERSERAIIEEIRSMNLLGLDILIAATHKSDWQKQDDFNDLAPLVRVLATGLPLADDDLYLSHKPLTFKNILQRPALARLLRKFQPDVLHAQFGHLGMLALPVAIRHGAPLVVSFRGQDVQLVERADARRREALFCRAARILARCESMRRDLTALGCPEGKVVTHPSPIRLKELPFRTRVSPADVLETRILMAGRMVEKKGMDDALRALALVRGRYGSQPFRLHIIGDGPMRIPLRRLAQELHLLDRVDFLSWMPHAVLVQEMLDAHLFLLPCRMANGDREGIPQVIKEAMATGLPVVSTNHAGIPEIIEPGVTGYLAQEGNPVSLAAALERALAEQSGWAEMGRRAAAAVQKFDSGILAQGLSDIYNKKSSRV